MTIRARLPAATSGRDLYLTKRCVRTLVACVTADALTAIVRARRNASAASVVKSCSRRGRTSRPGKARVTVITGRYPDGVVRGEITARTKA